MKTQLLAALASLTSHINALPATPSQSDIDSLTAEVTTVDTDVVAVINKPTGGGTGSTLDFTAFDAAVVAFKADTNLSQNDVNAVAHVIGINTP